MSNLIYRLTKGEPLTNEEVDGNFRHLEEKVENLGDVANINTTDEEGKFLSASGEWESIPKYSLATSEEDGLMSSQDKAGMLTFYDEYIDKYNTLNKAIQLFYTVDVTIPTNSSIEVSYEGVVWRRGLTIPKNTQVFIRNFDGSSEFNGLFQRQYVSEIIYWGNDISRLSLIGGAALSKVPSTIPSALTNMSQMFEDCSNFNQNIGTWAVGANITDMSSMFKNCSAFNQDLSAWIGTSAMSIDFALGAGFESNPEKHPMWSPPIEFEVWREGLPPKYVATASAEDNTFYEKDGLWFYVAPATEDYYEIEHLKTIIEPYAGLEGDFPTADITDKYGVTKSIPLNQIVTTFVTDPGTYISGLMYTFVDSNFNQYIGSWDMSNFTIANEFLSGFTSFNQPLNLDMPNCTEAEEFLKDCTSFNQPLDINMPLCEYADDFLKGCTSFNQPLSINMPNCVNAEEFLMGCTSFNQPLDINMPNCGSAYGFLRNCTSFNQPLNLDLPSCTDASLFLFNCSSFNQTLDINLPNCTSAGSFLRDCSSFDQDISNACVPKLTSAPSNWNSSTPESFRLDTSKHPVWGTCPSI